MPSAFTHNHFRFNLTPASWVGEARARWIWVEGKLDIVGREQGEVECRRGEVRLDRQLGPLFNPNVVAYIRNDNRSQCWRM
jgi:hypothetical protein